VSASTGSRGDGVTWLEEDEAARRLAVDGFVALWRGERRFITDLTDASRVVGDLVTAGRLEVDEHGVLIGVHGLVSRPTRHHIAHTQGTVNTWCALDAIGIPAALGIDADAITSCPACETELRVTLHRGVPVDRGAMRLWLPTSRCAHLVEDFCYHANLYCDHDHLSWAVAGQSAGRAIGVAEVAAIGRQTWSDVADAIKRSGPVS
jgi:hypothetical protein